MRTSQPICLVIALVMIHGAAIGEDFYLDSPLNEGLFRFEINNDALWDRDSNFTNGWSIQYHTVRYADWEESKAPKWIKWVGNHFPTLSHRDGIVRNGHGIGQNMLTPGDLSNPDPPEGDLPYAGTLTYTLNWQNFNRQRARIFQVNIGVLGEESKADYVQTYVHSNLLGMGEPQGWDTQRETEPILNLAYSQIWRLASWGTYNDGWAAQIAMSPSFHLGNLFTAAELGLALRFGWNIQEGFSAYPAPSGRGIFQGTHLPKPATVSPHGVELILGVRATGIFYTVIYDGSFMTDDDRSVDRNFFDFAAGFGLNYHYYNYLSLRLTILYGSNVLDDESLPEPLPGEDATSSDISYGTLVIDFHF